MCFNNYFVPYPLLHLKYFINCFITIRNCFVPNIHSDVIYNFYCLVVYFFSFLIEITLLIVLYSYIDQLSNGTINNFFRQTMPISEGGFMSEYPDFLAALLIIMLTSVLLFGVKISSKINITISILNLVVLLFIIGNILIIFYL